MCAAPAHDAEGHCNLSKQGCDSLDHIEGSRNDKLWACANPLCAADNMQQARTMQAQFHRVCLRHIEVCTLIHAYVQLIHANSYLYVYQYNNRNDPYMFIRHHITLRITAVHLETYIKLRTWRTNPEDREDHKDKD